MTDYRSFDVITFDCYGTLIDWETGILRALEKFRGENNLGASDDEVLEVYAQIESRIQGGVYIQYRQVLRAVMDGLARHYDVGVEEHDRDTLVDSIQNWLPFDDTVEALTWLRERYQLAIISNVDGDLFSYSAARLRVPFDHVTTAEYVKAYKPSLKNFEQALSDIAVDRDRILHVAQSRYHDIAPARELGLANVWVNRRSRRSGSGATPTSEAKPDAEVPSMAALVDLISTSL